MPTSDSRALVPAKGQMLTPRKTKGAHSEYALFEGDINLHNRSEVKEKLPDILGRALAKSWLDLEFMERFKANPISTLASAGVTLPDTIHIEFQKPNSARPKVVVYEQPEGSKFKLRVFYLQLVMVAGR